MTRQTSHFTLKFVALAILLFLMTSPGWSASYKILHSFSGQLASNPSSGLVLDKAGNAYGTTSAGGFNKAGAVYQLSPKTGFHVIYGFSGPDGRQPQGNLAVDADGNLYGTTVYGGANQSGCNNKGCGTVFRLSPPVNGGAWTQTVLYSFTGGDDGANPQGGVILDQSGNLYGNTEFGGSFQCGVVYQLLPNGNGPWNEVLLHTLTGDGCTPLGTLLFDPVGNLYGTTGGGGSGNGGIVFQLAPSLAEGADWQLTPLYEFDGFPGSKDGFVPIGAVTFDPGGTIYGVTRQGGEFGFGTVFALQPPHSGGSWSESILYDFAGGIDSASPLAGLVLDGTGNVYGSTFAGGVGCLGNGCGTLFKLTIQGGNWTESHFSFPANGRLGVQPSAPLLLHLGGLYGTTTKGGPLGEGTIFRVLP